MKGLQEVEMTKALVADLRELPPTEFANAVQETLAGLVGSVALPRSRAHRRPPHPGRDGGGPNRASGECPYPTGRRTVIRSAAHWAVLAETLLDSGAVAQGLGRTGRARRNVPNACISSLLLPLPLPPDDVRDRRVRSTCVERRTAAINAAHDVLRAPSVAVASIGRGYCPPSGVGSLPAIRNGR